MPLNLITDCWIPVRRVDRSPALIRPDEIADPAILDLDWPRADLNLSCLELLIGLVYLADPPADTQDWQARRAPDAARLRARLAALAPAFNLSGAGPLFLQDFSPLDGAANPPDMLFIDSAGESTAAKNADLMVRRGRYSGLDLPLAAMALYTLQAHAPLGGRGNRPSMRGGGPLVTLVDPGSGRLWDLVWANVPDGQAAGPDILPWMQPTRLSELKGSEVYPQQAHPAEAFFGMPRRLRLVVADERVQGVIQRPSSTRYAGWDHPLTPYYRMKAGAERIPVHPRAGNFGYRNWLGVVLAAPDIDELRQRAQSLETYERRVPYAERKAAGVIVAGYAMDQAKVLDFIWSRQPLLPLQEEAALTLRAMIEAAEEYGRMLRAALKPLVGEGAALDALREAFFISTQAGFDAGLAALLGAAPPASVAASWVRAMERVALGIFDRQALPGLDRKRPKEMAAIIAARDGLRAAFAGWSRAGRQLYDKLDITPRDKKTEAS